MKRAPADAIGDFDELNDTSTDGKKSGAAGSELTI